MTEPANFAQCFCLLFGNFLHLAGPQEYLGACLNNGLPQGRPLGQQITEIFAAQLPLQPPPEALDGFRSGDRGGMCHILMPCLASSLRAFAFFKNFSA